jgi:glucosylceramidase
MKKTLLLLLSIVGIASATAESYVPREGEVKFKMLQTTNSKAIHEVRNTPFTKHSYSLYETIDLDAAKPMHEYLGVGVSMTDASCWLLSQVDKGVRHNFFKKVFTKKGYNLSIVRLNCGSSDYATELYNYNDTKGDVEMKNFSIARDEKYMIPIIKSLKSYNPDIYTFSSIWSAPGWMKDSGEMCGGSLLDEHMPSFANYWAAYLKAYKEQGIEIDAITIQNEPLTDQRGGCPATLISAEQEALLASRYIPQSLKKAGVDTKIWIHDHNYEDYKRVLDILENKEVVRNIDAIAWHPYNGEPEMIQTVKAEYPNIPMHLTERGPNLTKLAKQDVKWWADVVFGALNNGCKSYSSWNLVLDVDGKPNVGKHPCGGLFTIDIEKETFTESVQAKLFRQFSPYVERGAKILSITQPNENIRAIAFQNPDGNYVVCLVAKNIPNKRQTLQLKYRGEYKLVSLPLNTWSMTTILIEK